MTLFDKIIFILYGFTVLFVGLFISRTRGKRQKNSTDYFLAGKSLPWYLVGTSIIAANISAEQFIGMSGSGYAIGLGIATYEWLAAAILIIVAKFFLPVFIEKRIFTMPQFLSIRYNDTLKSILAIFWIVLFIFVNLTSILYLGSLTLNTVFGISLVQGIWGLAVFALLYTITNGLKAIASTDIIQVFFLIAGGLLTTILAVNAAGDGEGVLHGFEELIRHTPEKWHMIIKQGDPNYTYLPGIRAIFGGIWIAGIYYFGVNQYIIQKALGAKNLREAQRGMVFAGSLKLILPIIVVIPGIVAYSLHADIAKPDEAYPWLLNRFIPPGIQGFVFAALIAAIVSSLSAIINSTSTIFTMDIYKVYIHPRASEHHLVNTGRISGIIATLIAATIAPFLGRLDQAFQFIQEYTGMVSPGITAVFLLGLFWKKTTSGAAIFGILSSIVASVVFKYLTPGIPFLDQMVLTFLVVVILMVIYSLIEGKRADNPRGISLSPGLLKTDRTFNIAATAILVILLVLYITFW